jgi:hypothetical protein
MNQPYKTNSIIFNFYGVNYIRAEVAMAEHTVAEWTKLSDSLPVAAYIAVDLEHEFQEYQKTH